MSYDEYNKESKILDTSILIVVGLFAFIFAAIAITSFFFSPDSPNADPSVSTTTTKAYGYVWDADALVKYRGHDLHCLQFGRSTVDGKDCDFQRFYSENPGLLVKGH